MCKHIGYISVQAEYDMNDVKLRCVSDEDLGVIVSDDVKRGKQCSEAVKKAKRILGIIKRILLIDLRKQ